MASILLVFVRETAAIACNQSYKGIGVVLWGQELSLIQRSQGTCQPSLISVLVILLFTLF